MVNERTKPSCPQWVGTAGFPNPSQQWYTSIWGFRTVRAGIVPGDNRFRPRFVEVVHIWKAFCSGDGMNTQSVPLASRTPAN